MNQREAEEIVNAVENHHQSAAIMLSFGKIEPGDYNKAKGYLEAMAQVEPLVQVLRVCATDPSNAQNTIKRVERAKEALALWDAAQGNK